MCRSYRRVRRTASSSRPAVVHAIQLRQDASIVEQGCAGNAPRSARWIHSLPSDLGWIAAPVCPDLIYDRYRNRSLLLQREGRPVTAASVRSKRRWPSEIVMQLDHIRGEIERMRIQVLRQRGEIRQLQRAGISNVSAEALLERMLNKIDELCTERDRLKKEQGSPMKGRVLGGRSWLLIGAGS